MPYSTFTTNGADIALAILNGILLLIISCDLPSEPLGIKVVYEYHQETEDFCRGLDVLNGILVAGASSNGYFRYNILDEDTNPTLEQVLHISDINPNVGDDAVFDVLISDNVGIGVDNVAMAIILDDVDTSKMIRDFQLAENYFGSYENWLKAFSDNGQYSDDDSFSPEAYDSMIEQNKIISNKNPDNESCKTGFGLSINCKIIELLDSTAIIKVVEIINFATNDKLEEIEIRKENETLLKEQKDLKALLDNENLRFSANLSSVLGLSRVRAAKLLDGISPARASENAFS